MREIGRYDQHPPTDLWWHKSRRDTGDETLYIACDNGTLVQIVGRSNIAPPVETAATTAKPRAKQRTARAAALEASVRPSTATTAAAAAPALMDSSPAALTSSNGAPFAVNDDDDDDDDDDSALFADDSPLKPQSRFIDDEADEDNDDGDDDDVKETVRPTASSDNAVEAQSTVDKDHGNDSVDDHDGYDDDDDDDDVDMQAIKDYTDNIATRHSFPSAIPLPESQPAFAPSSTPLDLTRRFMCWNHVGSITLMQGVPEPHLSSVDIQFTDSAFRRPISFTDNLGFILGSLGDDGAIFASDMKEEDDDDEDDGAGDILEGLAVSEATKAAVKQSHRNRMKKKEGSKSTGSDIYFHRFETFGNPRDKDWYLSLGDGERVLGCACGAGWAAVVTSRRFLRLFTSGGNQGQVIWLGGEPVTMVGRSRFLAVFYHNSTPSVDGTQKLGCLLYDAVANRVLTKSPVSCISTGSSLSWAGFDNDGSLLAMDSDGMVSMLVCSSSLGETTGQAVTGWEWVPMLDTIGLKKSADDSFWPITVFDGKLVCVPLKGGTKYPDAARRPVTTALGLRLPLARGNLTNM